MSPADGTPDRPSTSTGTRRAGFLHLPALVVDHRADLARDRADDEDVADPQRAALDQHGRERAAALVELGLDHRAFGGAVGIGLQLEDLGLQLDRLEQLVEIGLLERRDLDVLDVAAHVLDDDLVLEQLLADLLRHWLPGLSILLIATIIGTPAALVWLIASIVCGMIAVIGRDHQHDDVGDVGAARAHLGEGLVARRVEEGDLRLVGQRDLIGADMLGDAAGLARDDVGAADRVEQRRSCRDRHGP